MIPPAAPPGYRLEIDERRRFMFGGPREVPAPLLAFAYYLGIPSGTTIAGPSSRDPDWRLPIARRSSAWSIPITAAAAERPELLELLAPTFRALVGEPLAATVRELLADPLYVHGVAAVEYVELGRGWCRAFVDQAGRAVVRVIVAGLEHRQPADLDAAARLVPIDRDPLEAGRWSPCRAFVPTADRGPRCSRCGLPITDHPDSEEP